MGFGLVFIFLDYGLPLFTIVCGVAFCLFDRESAETLAMSTVFIQHYKHTHKILL